jgi:transcriptional regulator with XRE-family HTH domain
MHRITPRGCFLLKVRQKRRLKTRHRSTFIHEWRHHRNMTLEQLATKVGMTHASMSRIEQDKQAYKGPVLQRIASALDTDVASLLTVNPLNGKDLRSLCLKVLSLPQTDQIKIIKILHTFFDEED